MISKIKNFLNNSWLLISFTIVVLIINGETDGLTPVEGAKLLAAEIPHAELKIIERASHLVMMEQPEIVNKIIANFINQ